MTNLSHRAGLKNSTLRTTAIQYPTTFHQPHHPMILKGLVFLLFLFTLLGVMPVNGQVHYSVTSLTGSTYDTIPGGTVINSTAGLSTSMSTNQDDGAVLVTLPFTFTYNGYTFTQMTMCTNGWIGCGNQLSMTALEGRTAGNFFSTAVPSNTFAAWFRDMGANFGTGYPGKMVHGPDGTGIYSFEWKKAVGNSFSNTTANLITFKIKLYGPASSNPGRIEYLYGSQVGTLSTGAAIGVENMVGGSGNFLNALTNSFTSTTTSSAWPGNGNGYRFDPLPPCTTPSNQPTSLSLTPAYGSINGSFTAASGSPSGYLVVRYPSGATPTNPSDLIVYTVGNTIGSGIVVASGSGTTFSATNLTANTSYDFYIYSYTSATTASCGGPIYLTTSPLSGTSTTSSCSGLSAGTYSVGPTGTYATITAAAAALAGGTTGTVIFELQSTYTSASETFPITFAYNPCITTSGPVIIRPASGASSLTISGSNAGPTIDFNGAKYITIDGRPGGTGTTSQLSILNTNNAGTALNFINDASNITVNYCDLQGQNTSSTSTAACGVVYFSTASIFSLQGNDNITISNCNVHGTSGNTPSIAIAAAGTTTTAVSYNDNITISNCNIYDYFIANAASSGIKVDVGNTGWTITNNSFYQTATRTITSTLTQHRALWITPNTTTLNDRANGFTISGNYIGGNTTGAGGTAYTITSTPTSAVMYGMDISVGLGTATEVYGNTITNIAFTTTSTASPSFAGISCANGNVNIGAALNGNVIGASTGTGAITLTSTGSAGTAFGIRLTGGTGLTYNVSYNTVGGISINNGTISNNFIGISSIGGTTTNVAITNNIVGSTSTAGSISINGAGASGTSCALTGISVTSGPSASIVDISNNTVANLTNSTTSTGTSSGVKGIIQSTGVGNMVGNNVYNLSTTAAHTSSGASSVVIGMSMSSSTVLGTTGATVTDNTVYNLSNSSSATSAINVTGMFFSGPTAAVNSVRNNRIHSLNVTAANTNAVITGLDYAAGTSNVINNMVRLGIDGSGGSITTSLKIRGIATNSSSATNNFYHNSIYIGGTGVSTSTATQCYAFFRSSTSGTFVLRNNIFSIPRSLSASGSTVFFATYFTGTSGLTINNNLYYYNGTGGLFGYNGTANVSTYSPAWFSTDAHSLVGDPQFVNATGASSAVDLHISTSSATQVESGGVVVSGITTDFDGNTRAGNSGYSGSGQYPDIGADEGDFVLEDLAGPIMTHTSLLNTASTSNRTVTTVITDLSGIGTSTGAPRVYFKKGINGTYQSGTPTSTSGNTYTFTINNSSIGGVTQGDTVYYYLAAQDGFSTPNVSTLPAGGTGTTPPGSTPPSTLYSYRILGALSGTYVVGTNSCGSTSPAYATLTAAVAAYNSSGMSGPVTFVLTDSLYSTAETFPITINLNGDASATNTLTIQPCTNSVAKVQSSGTITLILNATTYVNIDGRYNGSGNYLTISNINTTTTSVPLLLTAGGTVGCSNVTVRNTTLKAGSTDLSGGTLVVGAQVQNNGHSNITFRENVFIKAYTGLIIGAGTITVPYSNIQVVDNVFGSSVPAHRLTFRGIRMFYSSNVTISGNEIKDVYTTLGVNNGGIEISTGSENVLMDRNSLHGGRSTNTGGWGFAGINILAGTNVTMTNNILYDNDATSWNLGNTTDQLYGIRIAAGTNIKVYNNAVNLDASTLLDGADYVSAALAIFGGTTIDVRNNILLNTIVSATASARAYPIMINGGSGITGDLNDYYTAGANGRIAGIAGTQYTSLAAFQAATTPQNINSISINPNFNSSTDLTPSSCPLDNVAATLAEVTVDYSGATRSSTPDIGAYEFSITPPSAPTANPNVFECQNSTASPLSATGGNIIWFSQPSGGTQMASVTPLTAVPDTMVYYAADSNTATSCISTRVPVTVTIGETTAVTANPTGDTVCQNSLVTLTSGSNGYNNTYQWYNGTSAVSGATSSVLSLSSAQVANNGNYSLVVSGACGSDTTSVATLLVHPNLMADVSVNATSTAVCGSSPITFTATPTNGGSSPSYLWKVNGSTVSGATSATYVLNGPVAGDEIYAIMTSNSAGPCLVKPVDSSAVVILTSNTVTPTVNISTSNTTVCPGIPVSFTSTGSNLGGSPDYVWKINGSSTGDTNSTFNSSTLASGDIVTLDVVSSASCTSTPNATSNPVAMTVLNNTAINTQPVSTITQCVGTNAALFAIATGSGSLAYQWKKNGVTISGATSPSINLSNLNSTNSGSYTVDVTGTCGSVTSTASVVTVNDLTAISTQPVSSITQCNGTSASLSVAATGSGTLTYQWKKNGTAISGATSSSLSLSNMAATDAGIYTVDVTATCGTVTSSSSTVTVNPLTSITTQPVGFTQCAGTTQTLAVLANGAGTLTYQWKKGGVPITGATSSSLTLSNLATSNSGSYTVDVTGTCGTVTSSSVAVQVNLVTASASSTSILCNGGTSTVSISASGGTSPYTGTGNFTVSAGSYTYTVYDNIGCVGSTTVNVTQPAVLTYTVSGVTNVNCFGGATGAVTTNTAGGTSSYNYAWSNSSSAASISGLTAGTYSATVTDANNCTATLSQVVTQNPAITSSSIVIDEQCDGDFSGGVLYSAAGGAGSFNYLWNDPNNTNTANVNNLSNGTYTVTATDALGCTKTNSYTVNTLHQLPFVIITGVDTICGDGESTLDAGFGFIAYDWNTTESSQTITANTTGTYTVQVQDVNGCFNTASFDLFAYPLLTSTTSSTNTHCAEGNDGSVAVVIGGGVAPYTYLWSDSATSDTASGLGEGIYTVLATDDAGCTIMDTVAVGHDFELPVVDLGPDTVFCFWNASVDYYTLDAGTFITYLWSTSDVTQTITINSGGVYSLLVSDANGCFGTDSVTIDSANCLNVEEVVSSVVAEIYPNPTRGSVNVNISGISGEVDVVLMGMDGRTIRTEQWIVTSGQPQTLELEGLSQGMYLMVMQQDKWKATERIIKE